MVHYNGVWHVTTKIAPVQRARILNGFRRPRRIYQRNYSHYLPFRYRFLCTFQINVYIHACAIMHCTFVRHADPIYSMHCALHYTVRVDDCLNIITQIKQRDKPEFGVVALRHRIKTVTWRSPSIECPRHPSETEPPRQQLPTHRLLQVSGSLFFRRML